MAIETTYFTGTTAAANYAEVSAWLTANAAEYFDEITGAENVITCKIGGVNALTLNFTGRTLDLDAPHNSTLTFGSKAATLSDAVAKYRGVMR